jgi:response regulator of citrate/malate metabolism
MIVADTEIGGFMGRRILVVEDDPGMQKILRYMLEKIDQQNIVRTAGTAEEGFALLQDSAVEDKLYDLAIVDLQLPGSDGVLLWEVAMRRFSIQFLFVSGVSYEQWVKRTEGVKAPLWLLKKPVTEVELRRFWRHAFPQ